MLRGAGAARPQRNERALSPPRTQNARALRFINKRNVLDSDRFSLDSTDTTHYGRISFYAAGGLDRCPM
jgi:hypothetical protein